MSAKYQIEYYDENTFKINGIALPKIYGLSLKAFSNKNCTLEKLEGNKETLLSCDINDIEIKNKGETSFTTYDTIEELSEALSGLTFNKAGSSALSTKLPSDTVDADGNPLEATKIYTYTNAGWVEADALLNPKGTLAIGYNLSDSYVEGFTGLIDGENYYINEGGGIISETDMQAQFQSGSDVVKIGQAMSDTILYFNPDETIITLASDVNIDDLDTYSTEETIIGTWIDGKPIYRKVIETGTITGNYYQVNLPQLNVDTPIRNDCTITNTIGAEFCLYTKIDYNSYGAHIGTVIYTYDLQFTRSPATEHTSIRLEGSRIYQDGTEDYLITGCSAKIILEYTKTTD